MAFQTISIIGGDGKMGKWLINHFSDKGMQIKSIDLRDKKRKKENFEILSLSDMVFVSVPIAQTAGVIQKVSRIMKPGAVLAEIASFKSKVIQSLRETAELGLIPLSLHPMFGPTAESVKDKVVAVIPVVDREGELSLAKSLFSGAEFITLDWEEHDKAMAVVLSLPYLMNLAIAQVIGKSNPKLLRKIAGTTYTVQSNLALSIVNENTDLLEAIIKENQFLDGTLEEFNNALNQIQDSIKDSKFRVLHQKLVKTSSTDPSYSNAEQARYQAFKVMKSLN